MRAVVDSIAHAWLANRHWMAWNLGLAVIPALLAVPLFRPGRAPRGTAWWCGAVAFALFLPNAPYVLTDVIHLPEDVAAAPTRSAVLFGFLPSFGLFMAIGLVAYAFCLHRLRRWLGWRLGEARWIVVEGVVHLAAAVGVLLGRVARLNSWDAVVDPGHTLRTTSTSLTDPRALVVVVAFAAVLFVVGRIVSACRVLVISIWSVIAAA